MGLENVGSYTWCIKVIRKTKSGPENESRTLSFLIPEVKVALKKIQLISTPAYSSSKFCAFYHKSLTLLSCFPCHIWRSRLPIVWSTFSMLFCFVLSAWLGYSFSRWFSDVITLLLLLSASLSLSVHHLKSPLASTTSQDIGPNITFLGSHSSPIVLIHTKLIQ